MSDILGNTQAFKSVGSFQKNNNKIIVFGHEQKELMGVLESCMQIK